MAELKPSTTRMVVETKTLHLAEDEIQEVLLQHFKMGGGYCVFHEQSSGGISGATLIYRSETKQEDK